MVYAQAVFDDHWRKIQMRKGLPIIYARHSPAEGLYSSERGFEVAGVTQLQEFALEPEPRPERPLRAIDLGLGRRHPSIPRQQTTPGHDPGATLPAHQGH